MSSWLVDATLGIALGVILYACVRMRMYAGPRLREAYGKWPRRIFWALMLLLMIVIGNLMLYALRFYLHSAGIDEDTLVHELLFAVIALILGLWLVMGRVRRKK